MRLAKAVFGGNSSKGKVMSIINILLVLLVLSLFGVLPFWGYSSGWGYGPTGGLLLLIIVLAVMLSSGRLKA